MTDLELIDKVCDDGVDMIHPVLFRKLESRGLVHYFNYLGTTNADECKSFIRARLSRVGRYMGDPEIEKIADAIERLNALREQLVKISMTDAFKVISIAAEMQELGESVRDYFKPVRIP